MELLEDSLLAGALDMLVTGAPAAAGIPAGPSLVPPPRGVLCSYSKTCGEVPHFLVGILKEVPKHGSHFS